jgi:hypothetical protein
MSVAAPYTVRTMPRTTANPKTGRFELKISTEGESLLIRCAAELGISKAAVVEQAIRIFARQNNITTEQPTHTADTTPPYETDKKDAPQ